MHARSRGSQEKQMIEILIAYWDQQCLCKKLAIFCTLTIVLASLYRTLIG